MRRIFDALADLDVPKIHFGTGTGHLLAAQREAGGTVIGVDWRTPLDEGWRLAGDGVAVQGNLDPTLLFGPRERLLARVDDVLRRAGGRPGPRLQPRARHPARDPDGRRESGGRPRARGLGGRLLRDSPFEGPSFCLVRSRPAACPA